MTGRLALAAALCLVTIGCKGQQQTESNEAGKSAAAPTLIGAWATETPARFSGEGLRTETTGGRTTYGPANRFDYAGRLTIYGEKLPAGGISFRIAAKGDWRLQGRTLSEDYTEVSVTPEVPNPALDQLADQLAGEMAASPVAQADIVEFTQTGLMLRDKATGKTSTYSRL